MQATTAPPASQSSPATTARGWLVLLLSLLALAAPLWQLHIIDRNMPPNKADMVAVWKGTQAALRGQDPYSQTTTDAIQDFYYGRELTPNDKLNPMAFAYPLHTVFFFAPIAPLPWSIVRIGFFILLPLATAAGALFWIRVMGLRLTRVTHALTVVLTLCSWPAMWGTHQIQPTLLVAPFAAASCLLLRRGRPVVAGLCLIPLTIKPQLFAIFIAWLLLWALLRHVWQVLVSFALTLAILLACAEWLLPGWIADWRRAGSDYVSYRHLELDLQLLFGHTLGLILAGIIGIIGLAMLWRRRHCAPDSRDFGAMCALCLALNVCLLPNGAAMNYNQILLLPAGLLLVFIKPTNYYAALSRRLALGLVVWSFLAVPCAILGEALSPTSAFWYKLPFQVAILPLCVIVALTLAFSRSKFVQSLPA